MRTTAQMGQSGVSSLETAMCTFLLVLAVVAPVQLVGERGAQPLSTAAAAMGGGTTGSLLDNDHEFHGCPPEQQTCLPVIPATPMATVVPSGDS